VEDDPSVEYIARYIGTTQQKYTQRGGVRPFGLAVLLGGVDFHGKPQLWSSDPSGVYSSWKANAVGRNSKSLLEMLEKSYVENCSHEDGIKLAVKALLEVVESGAASIEIGVIKHKTGLVMMTPGEIEAVVKVVEEEKANAATKNQENRMVEE
jgi:20S proteasome subunit alpha 4